METGNQATTRWWLADRSERRLLSRPVVYALLRCPFLLTAVRRNLGWEKIEETGAFTIVYFAFGSELWAECFVLGNSESEFSRTTSASFYITSLIEAFLSQALTGRIGKSMFGLYVLAGGRLLVLGKGWPTPTSVGITPSDLTCLLRASARKPFGDRNEESYVCRCLDGHTTRSCLAKQIVLLGASFSSRCQLDGRTSSCLAKNLCLEPSFRHVAIRRDVRGVASLRNCDWSRHFVTLPTCLSLTFGGRWDFSNVDIIFLAARSTTLSSWHG